MVLSQYNLFANNILKNIPQLSLANKANLIHSNVLDLSAKASSLRAGTIAGY
jgi:hypothetical protein